MDERLKFRPFTGDAERKVKLVDAPLALVLVQIRWPEHARFARDFRSLALDFGERLKDFPLFQEVNEAGIQITPNGVEAIQGATAYQWQSINGVWTVHLAPRFVSVYCLSHSGYKFSDLLTRVDDITKLLKDVLQVRSLERIGVRYVNRVSDPTVLDGLGQVFDPAVLGYANLEINDGITPVNSVAQAMYKVDELMLHARSGYLNPGDSMDAAVPGLDRKSWVLDLDGSDDSRREFEPSVVSNIVGRISDMVYDFFKLVLKPGQELRLEGSA